MLVWEELDIIYNVVRHILSNLVTTHIPYPSCMIGGDAGHVVSIRGDSYAENFQLMSPSVCFERFHFDLPCLYFVVSKGKTSGAYGFPARMSRLDNIP